MINLREATKTEVTEFPGHTVIETTLELFSSTHVSNRAIMTAKLDLVEAAKEQNLLKLYKAIYENLEKELINLIREMKATDPTSSYLYGNLIERAMGILEMIESTHAKPEPQWPKPVTEGLAAVTEQDPPPKPQNDLNDPTKWIPMIGPKIWESIEKNANLKPD